MKAKFRYKIGDKVKVKGLNYIGTIRYVRYGEDGDKKDVYNPHLYRVYNSKTGAYKYWRATSLRKVK